MLEARRISPFDELRERAEALVPVLRERAAKTEALRRIPDETIADLHRSGLFRMVQPARVGGSELPYNALIELTSIVGRGCGSTAWVLNNLASHHWMVGYWPKEAQDEIWGPSPDALIGSAFIFPGGRARKVKGGYRLSGRWPFSSGIDASQWNMIAAVVPDEQTGASEYRVFLLPASDYTVIDTWYVSGLAGTGSKDVVVNDVFVPEHRTLPTEAGKGGASPGSAVNPSALVRALRLRHRRRLARHRQGRDRAICAVDPHQARDIYRPQPRRFLDHAGPCGGGGRADRRGRGAHAQGLRRGHALGRGKQGAADGGQGALAARRRLCGADVHSGGQHHLFRRRRRRHL